MLWLSNMVRHWGWLAALLLAGSGIALAQARRVETLRASAWTRPG